MRWSHLWLLLFRSSEVVAVLVEKKAACKRGRVMVAFGAHTDDLSVQSEVDKIFGASERMACHDLVLFVDGARDYDVLRHPLGEASTVRFNFGLALKNGTSAFKRFVSHQLLMAAVPWFVDDAYESVWVIEEDARFSGDWAALFGAFENSKADLTAHSRKTNRGTAALMAVAKVSTKLLRKIPPALDALDRGDDVPYKKNIHGAFLWNLCRRASWCTYERIDQQWLAVFRAKCPWSADIYEQIAPSWQANTKNLTKLTTPGNNNGFLFHPVKAQPHMTTRDFKRFRCRDHFLSEHVPPHLIDAMQQRDKTSTSSEKIHTGQHRQGQEERRQHPAGDETPPGDDDDDRNTNDAASASSLNNRGGNPLVKGKTRIPGRQEQQRRRRRHLPQQGVSAD